MLSFFLFPFYKEVFFLYQNDKIAFYLYHIHAEMSQSNALFPLAQLEGILSSAFSYHFIVVKTI